MEQRSEVPKSRHEKAMYLDRLKALRPPIHRKGKGGKMMKLCDSFFVVGKKTTDISKSIHHARKVLGIKFVTRYVEEEIDGKLVKGTRVWRI